MKQKSRWETECCSFIYLFTICKWHRLPFGVFLYKQQRHEFFEHCSFYFIALRTESFMQESVWRYTFLNQHKHLFLFAKRVPSRCNLNLKHVSLRPFLNFGCTHLRKSRKSRTFQKNTLGSSSNTAKLYFWYFFALPLHMCRNGAVVKGNIIDSAKVFLLILFFETWNFSKWSCNGRIRFRIKNKCFLLTVG